MKQRLYEILEVGHPNDSTSRVFDEFIVVLIVANVAAVALETVESLSPRFAGTFGLLVLEAHDFRDLLEADANVREEITRVA